MFRSYATYIHSGVEHFYQSGKANITYKSAFFTCPYATAAKLIWNATATKARSGGAETRRFIWSTAPLTVSNGTIGIPSNICESVADVACSICGYSAEETNIDLGNFYLLVDFEFPARLDGVDWNWQPQYT